MAAVAVGMLISIGISLAIRAVGAVVICLLAATGVDIEWEDPQ